MQPLKRFTQCGSLTMLFVVFIVLFGVSSTALTTFGKTNPNQLQPPTTPPVKGRECNAHSDCATLQDTSCVKDREDGKTRCLCGDNNAPYNGQCNAKFKGLRHLCTQTNDCLEAMVCAVDNSTKTFGLSKLISSQQEKDKPKQCLCDEANGYQENVKELYCSGATTQIITNVLGPLLSVIVSFITSSPSVQYHSYH